MRCRKEKQRKRRMHVSSVMCLTKKCCLQHMFFKDEYSYGVLTKPFLFPPNCCCFWSKHDELFDNGGFWSVGFYFLFMLLVLVFHF